MISSFDRNDVPAVLGGVVLVERIDPAVLNSILPFLRCRTVLPGWLVGVRLDWVGRARSAVPCPVSRVPWSDYIGRGRDLRRWFAVSMARAGCAFRRNDSMSKVGRKLGPLRMIIEVVRPARDLFGPD